mmetsp:Transcript_27677/g.83019  ORF Transcript_27677/g.83019 Transcript_27677/m.83019 type:complete len:207 (-) Transcript_27677:49-669(-)
MPTAGPTAMPTAGPTQPPSAGPTASTSLPTACPDLDDFARRRLLVCPPGCDCPPGSYAPTSFDLVTLLGTVGVATSCPDAAVATAVCRAITAACGRELSFCNFRCVERALRANAEVVFDYGVGVAAQEAPEALGDLSALGAEDFQTSIDAEAEAEADSDPAAAAALGAMEVTSASAATAAPSYSPTTETYAPTSITYEPTGVAVAA